MGIGLSWLPSGVGGRVRGSFNGGGGGGGGGGGQVAVPRISALAARARAWPCLSWFRGATNRESVPTIVFVGRASRLQQRQSRDYRSFVPQ